ncbi:MAG: hypothetical protein K0M39_13680 [Rhizobium sp.]|nr:hypothetical protein [Rhizobium sp.]
MLELNHLRQCSRPVVFETGIPSAPYSIAGTAFLVAFHRTLFVITARHVVRDHPVNRLRIFPSDRSIEGLRLSDWWHIEDPKNDPDSSDILLIRADLTNVPKSIRKSNHLLHLTPPSVSEWFDDRYISRFFLFGYPSATNEADYAHSKLQLQQFFLPGRYVGPSIAHNCHELLIENPLNLSDFNGLSGSPVFCLRNEIAISRQPTFCGMAIRGSARSQRAHFIEASTILLALQEAIEAH